MSSYKPPFWQIGGHLQTIVPYLFPQTTKQLYFRERWELDDGDFVDVDWTEPHESSGLKSESCKPILILFHGLEGNSQSHYSRTLMQHARTHHWIGVVVHFRGCSGEPNRLPRVYYAGDAQEINRLIQIVKQKKPNSLLYAVGVSLGGNALLKWLGEYPINAKATIQAAVSVSAPIDLKQAVYRLEEGLNYWLYNKNFVATLKPKALAMASRFPNLLSKERIFSAYHVRQIDDSMTAVLYGAKNADEYYHLNASKAWLPYIQSATLILNAQNDPFVPFKSLPSQEQVSTHVTLEYPENGGHAGFYGSNSANGKHWLAERIFNFFQVNQAK